MLMSAQVFQALLAAVHLSRQERKEQHKSAEQAFLCALGLGYRDSVTVSPGQELQRVPPPASWPPAPPPQETGRWHRMAAPKGEKR